MKFTDYLTNKINKLKKTAALFLDFEKAFDKVWYEGLIHKLMLLETNQQLVKIINSFLTERTYSMKVSDILSTLRIMKASVP